MCLICIDFDRGALKPKEARRAFREMRSQLDPAHAREVEQKLDEAERAGSVNSAGATTAQVGPGAVKPRNLP